MTFTATLTLSQQGRLGEVVANVDYTGDLSAGAESHECMESLERIWGEMKGQMESGFIEGDDTEYSATLTLSQDAPGSDVFTKLEMHPRLSFGDPNPVPSSYEAICFLAQVWLQMCGIIDDEGNVLNEDAVERSMDLKVTASPTVH